jgi:hypothetical protein
MENIVRNPLSQSGKKNIAILIAIFLLLATACGSSDIKVADQGDIPTSEEVEMDEEDTGSGSYSMRTPFLLTFHDAPSQLLADIRVLSGIRVIRGSRDGWIIKDGHLIEAPWCGFELLEDLNYFQGLVIT